MVDVYPSWGVDLALSRARPARDYYRKSREAFGGVAL